VGQKTQGTGTPAFSKDGAIGSMFKADGAIGGTVEKIGGPFASDGIVGLVSPFLDPSFSLCQTTEVKVEPFCKAASDDAKRSLTRRVGERKPLSIIGLRGCWKSFLMWRDM
jgi:hypothetical protein